MPTPNWNKHVHKHGSWQSLTEGVWEITGTLGRGSMTRNMVAAKIPSGGLVLHSVIAMNDSEFSKLQSFGTPEYMIVPSPLHRLDAAVYLERFPNIKVICPALAVDKVKQKVRVDGSCEEVLPKLGFKYHAIPGVKESELSYEFGTTKDKAIVFCDAVMHLPHLPGFDGKLMKWLGSTGFFGMTKIGKVLLLKDKTKFAGWLRLQAQRNDLKAISVAHGTAVTTDIPAHLEKAAARF